MKAEDIYIRLTDPTGKYREIVSHHRVWDRQRFLESQRKQNNKPDKPDEHRRVSIASEADYRKFMGYKEHAA
ncbi:hypothetical protein [Pseudomonas panipatensis]|uniref:Uncharacterized protein n=1 Tax=Pseudomonas panipatensis TaxID=428992 RepID=A0A1G8LGK9_9PSED|nr:hypothetical protein [Pseudomonas panipatensis]SDI54831.1 hypothetical protein SAMN05216272_111143 [Pseudomonas panipatensis]SMP74938.1 hypothetical protein SAMN06295951_11357 [Pseudomonas panipatensis]